MAIDERAREGKTGRIRLACLELGADAEMIALVLASYRHDPEALEILLTEGGSLLGYVRSKMARWEAILEGDCRDLPPTDRAGRSLPR